MWTLEYNAEQHFIDLVFDGLTNAEDVRRTTTEGLALGRRHACRRYLLDIERMQSAVSFLTIIDLPNRQYIAEGLDRRSAIAVVLPFEPAAREVALFYEPTMLNRGFEAKTFPSRDEALRWLLRE